MSERKLSVACDYCGAAYAVLFPPENEPPTFCPYCGEYLVAESVEETETESDYDEKEEY